MTDAGAREALDNILKSAAELGVEMDEAEALDPGFALLLLARRGAEAVLAHDPGHGKSFRLGFWRVR